jgi:hypothetical protein
VTHPSGKTKDIWENGQTVVTDPIGMRAEGTVGMTDGAQGPTFLEMATQHNTSTCYCTMCDHKSVQVTFNLSRTFPPIYRVFKKHATQLQVRVPYM